MHLLLLRYTVFRAVLVLVAIFAVLGIAVDHIFYWPQIILVPLALVGVYDTLQPWHAILRNYPIIGHIRFLLEAIHPH